MLHFKPTLGNRMADWDDTPTNVWTSLDGEWDLIGDGSLLWGHRSFLGKGLSIRIKGCLWSELKYCTWNCKRYWLWIFSHDQCLKSKSLIGGETAELIELIEHPLSLNHDEDLTCLIRVGHYFYLCSHCNKCFYIFVPYLQTECIGFSWGSMLLHPLI